jgi:hypothetical protein
MPRRVKRAKFQQITQRRSTAAPSRDATLTQEQQGLIKFMVDERNIEVHESGSSRTPKTEEIKVGVGGTYSDKSGTLEVQSHSIRTNRRPIAIMRRSCSDSPSTASQLDRVFGSDREYTEYLA